MHLRLSNLSKSYGDRILFSGASLVLNHGERVGLVGPNGSGKTTLLRLILGLERSDDGAVELSPKSCRLGYLPQALSGLDNPSVVDALDSASPAWRLLPGVESAGERLARGEIDLHGYETLLGEFVGAGGYEAVDRMNEALAGLGIAGIQPSTPLGSLSGGQKTKAALAGLLSEQPDFLLLDEPTNHLDIEAIGWLESFLDSYSGAMLVVSHDRAFLDTIVTRIVEISPEAKGLKSYEGGYSDYVLAKQKEYHQAVEVYDRQQEKIERFEESIRGEESRARGIENRTIDYAIRAKAQKIARAVVVHKARLVRELDREGRLDKPKTPWQMLASFTPVAESGQEVVSVGDLSVSFRVAGGDDGPEVNATRIVPALRGVDLLVRQGERLVLTGPNGSGKTTLLRAIASAFPEDADVEMTGRIRIGNGVRLGYFAQGQDNLPMVGTPLGILRDSVPFDETEARRFLHRFLFSGDDVFQPIRSLSYGQRARLLLGLLVARGANLLLLDEPFSHLDLPSRERFEEALLGFSGTIVTVLHDRYAIDRLATRLVWLDDGRIKGGIG